LGDQGSSSLTSLETTAEMFDALQSCALEHQCIDRKLAKIRTILRKEFTCWNFWMATCGGDGLPYRFGWSSV